MNNVITVEQTISMGHRLPSYDGICSSPHGHNVRFVVSVRTEGFFDFKHLSGDLLRVIADFDHAMVLAGSDPIVQFLEGMSFRLVLLNVEPSTEAIAQVVFNELSRNTGYEVLTVVVHETAKYSATASSRYGPVQRIR